MYFQSVKDGIILSFKYFDRKRQLQNSDFAYHYDSFIKRKIFDNYYYLIKQNKRSFFLRQAQSVDKFTVMHKTAYTKQLQNMASLPRLPTLNKKHNPQSRLSSHSFLKIYPSHPSFKNSLQKQAIEAIHNNHFLYIDFQSKNSLIELEKQEEKGNDSQDQVEKLGRSSITGMKNLQKLCFPSFRMHKFIKEQQHHLDKRNNWKRLLGRDKLRESLIDFKRVQEKINPEKLQDFLEDKDLEQQWKKIIAREEQLYRNEQQEHHRKLSHSLKLRQPNQRLLRGLKPQMGSRIKLNGLKKLNNLLHQK